ncbi:MAG: hypothetical protein ACREOF_09360 [Gemmatimonadales bacterium]
MGKLRNAGLVAAALVLAGTGTLAAQDTSYTRIPVEADTSADTAPLADTAVSDTAVSDTAISDSAVTDTVVDTLTPDAAPAETPPEVPGEAKEEGHEGHKAWDEGKKTGWDEDAKRDEDSAAVDEAQTLPDSTKP